VKEKNYLIKSSALNPFFRDHLSKVQEQMEAKCMICEDEACNLLYECGHCIICFNCWNQGENSDFRSKCMLCKANSVTVTRIVIQNFLIGELDSYRP